MAPVMQQLASSDPVHRASACTAIGGLIVNSGAKGASFCAGLASRGVAARVVALMVDPNPRVCVSATRAVAKFAMCGGASACMYLLTKADALTPILALLKKPDWVSALPSDVLSTLVADTLTLLCSLCEEAQGVAKTLTESGTLLRISRIFTDANAPPATRVGAGRVLSVASEDNEAFARAAVEVKPASAGAAAVPPALVAIGALAADSKTSPRLRSLGASVLLNFSEHRCMAQRRKSLLETTIRSVSAELTRRPVAALPRLAAAVAASNAARQSKIAAATAEQREIAAAPSRKKAAAVTVQHRANDAWEGVLDEWFDGAVAVKLSLETLANLCTAGPDVDTNETAAREFQAVLTAVIKMSLPAKLGLLMRDDLAMASSLGGAGGGTGQDAKAANELTKAWQSLRSSLPTAQAVRLGRFLSSLSKRCLECMFNLVLHLPARALGDTRPTQAVLSAWTALALPRGCDRPAKRVSSQVEQATGVLWQLASKRCGVPTDLGVFARLSRAGDTPGTRRNCMMLLSQAGLFPQHAKANYAIGQALMGSIQGKGDPSLEVVAAGVEAIIDLYSEDDAFGDEIQRLGLAARLAAFAPVYEQRLRSAEGAGLDTFDRERQVEMLQNLKAFAQYLAQRR